MLTFSKKAHRTYTREILYWLIWYNFASLLCLLISRKEEYDDDDDGKTNFHRLKRHTVSSLIEALIFAKARLK